jgi:predicted RNA-binding Zn-ribbon protein involved in translation (DUF1610 family)
VKVSVDYQNGRGPREEEWNVTPWHCPTCGAKAVWTEEGPGDYYMGTTHLCVACGVQFYLPSPPFHTDSKDWLAPVLAQIKEVW